MNMTRLSVRMRKHLGGLSSALAMVSTGGLMSGCEGDDATLSNPGADASGGDSVVPTAGKLRLHGRFTGDRGNQPVLNVTEPRGNTTSAVTAVEIATIAADGSLEPVASETVSEDGTYAFEEVPAGSGPLIIRGTNAAGETGGMAIVPAGTLTGEEVAVVPVSDETTAEAEALIDLVSEGTPAADVDTIALMTTVSSDVAASAEGGAELGQPAMNAQLAWRSVIGATSAGPVSASAAEAAKVDGYAALVASLETAASEQAKAEAWAAFAASTSASIATELGADGSAQSVAASAAASAFAATALDAGSSTELRTSVAATGAWLVAQVDQVDLAHAVAAHADASAALDGSYSAFFEALGEAKGTAAVGEAWTALTAASAELAADLRAHVEGGAEAGPAVEAIFASAASARVELTAALDDTANAESIANAYVDFYDAVALSASAAASAGVDGSLVVVASHAATQAQGGVAILLNVTGTIDVGTTVTVTAVIDAAAHAQAGAAGLLAGLDAKAVLSSATSASLLAKGASGEWVVVATGTIAAGVAEFEDVPAIDAGESWLVELTGAEGAVVGATWIDGALPAGGQVTIEGTVETLVALGAGNEHPLAPALVAELVTGATASAALAEGEVDALGSAVVAAQVALETSLGTSAAPLVAATANAHAALEAALDKASTENEVAAAHAAFQAALWASLESLATSKSDVASSVSGLAIAFSAAASAGAGAESTLSVVVDAEAKLMAAAAASAAISGALAADGASTDILASVEASVDAYAEATAAAVNAADVSAAGQAYLGATVGGATSDGAIEAHLAAALGLTGGVLYGEAVLLAKTAAATFSLTVQAAVASATSGATVDAEGLAAAVASAHAEFMAAVTVAFEGKLGLALTSSDVDLAASLTATAYGTLVGSN